MEGEIRPQISWTANKVVLLQKVMNYAVNNYRFGHQKMKCTFAEMTMKLLL